MGGGGVGVPAALNYFLKRLDPDDNNFLSTTVRPFGHGEDDPTTTGYDECDLTLTAQKISY